MALSLLGYFFYLVTAFSIAMTLMLRLSDVPTLQKIHHNERVIQTIAAAKTKHRRQSVELAAKEQFANPVSSQNPKVADKVAIARITPNNHSRHARVDVLKLLSQQRDKYDHRDRIALGYADERGYRPGLDGQR